MKSRDRGVWCAGSDARLVVQGRVVNGAAHGEPIREEYSVESIIVVAFNDRHRAVEALQELQQLHDTDAIKLRAAAVAERRADGTWCTVDETEIPSMIGTAAGGVIGALIGVLTGPLGLLLGATAALMAGELVDVKEDQETELILNRMIAHVAPGTAALLADVKESAPDTVDAAMEKLGGRVMRRSRDDVEAELRGADSAIETARREAKRALHRLKMKLSAQA